MSVANEKTLRDLEYDRLKDVVKGFASSSLGEEAIDALAPLSDRAEIEEAIAEVKEAIVFLEPRVRFSLAGVHDLAPLFLRAKEQALLGGEELLLIQETIDATGRVRAELCGQESCPTLRRFGERLSEEQALAKRIRQAIDEHGALRDDASPRLTQLVRKRRSLEDRIERKLRALIDRSPELISEAVVTRRSGRLVIPIKSGAQGLSSDFVVHDRSATGQTLYAEPIALVPENNAIAETESEIRDERLRILRELTDEFRAAEPAFLRDRALLAHLDSLFARAGYGIARRARFPNLTSRIRLQDARHPLLPADQVVPVSLSLGDPARMVVITGPNTGGKTVTLKTIGLFTLMVQSAIPIPAAYESEMTVRKAVWSDIGDEQSISQNLSTFSAHMRNIVTLLQQVDADSLVLLDELGAGTDPQEGAALGLAILEQLLVAEPLVAVSTHLTPLKYFAIRHPAVKTASMEFDVESLRPTFRVIEGVPGRSNAFIIARSLGLSEELVERARSFLSQGEILADDILEDLERERQAMLHRREQTERELSEATRVKETYTERLAAFQEKKERELSKELKDLESFLRMGQEEVERLLAELRAKPTPDEARAAYQELVRLRDAVRETKEAAKKKEGEPLPLEEIEVGRIVHVRSLDADGRIVQIAPRGKVTVDLDGVRVSTEPGDLERAHPTKAEPTARPSVLPRPTFEQVSLQLNVRGMTVSEALREVELYLDRLLLADVERASILHGKGTGALREAIRAYLASSSFVKSFRSAPPAKGGDGVTDFDLEGE